MNQPLAQASASARRLLAQTSAPGIEDPLALAWALKQHCYDFWSAQPRRSVLAAETLQALADASHAGSAAAEIRALADWTAGIAMTTQGRMPEAVLDLDRAHAGFLALGKPDEAAQTQVPKIMALSMLGRHDEAAACAARTAEALTRAGNFRAAGRVSQNLGGLHLRRDQYVQAARHYREAAVLFARVGDSEQSILADIGLGDALAAQGEFEPASLMYARARLRAEHRELAVPLALVDESMALVDLALGRYGPALAGLESARRRYATLDLPQHLAIAEKQLGDAYLELRLLPEAMRQFDAAIRRFHELALPDEQAGALAQRARAEVLAGRGDAAGSLDAAEALFVTQSNTVGLAGVSLTRAEMAISRADGARALAWASEAVQRHADAGHPEGRDRAHLVSAQALLLLGRASEARQILGATLASAVERQQIALHVHARTGLGQVALAEHDPATALREFDAAIDLFETLRGALPGDELRRSLLGAHLLPYRERLRLALDRGDPVDVLAQLDRYRARTLDERLQADEVVVADAQVDALRARLSWLYRRAARQHEEGAASAALAEETTRFEGELLEHARRVRFATGRLPEARADYSVAALIEALGSGSSLIEYGVIEDELFACVVDARGARLLRHLASWRDVEEAVRGFRFQIETLRSDSPALQRHLPLLQRRVAVRLARLHALIWAPLATQVIGQRRLMIVPHGVLGTIPFSALPQGDAVLAQHHELACAPSARIALRGLRSHPRPLRRVLAVGSGGQLAHTTEEANRVVQWFASGVALTGTQARVEAVIAGAPAADVLHLACHATFRHDNPRFSALHLEGGALTAEQVETLHLGPCTVVLSACDTGLSEVGSGDEVIGLVRAFMIAGAVRVVASLWPVEDGTTAEFMGHFYRSLVATRTPAAALAEAQQAMAADHGHPFHWSAFVLYGGF